MMKRLNPNDPLRPRNIRKRQSREARKSHKRLMAEKRKAEASAVDGDKSKVFHAGAVAEVKKRIARIKESVKNPFRIESLRRGVISRVLVINRDGKKRELLPDKPDRHVILCHGCVAKVITSGVCVFSKVTQHEYISDEGTRSWIDGSWTIAPCSPAMLRGTTVQHVRRRSWFFLRRYWYEISFDGRVQPAGMFYDYDIDPRRPQQSFYVTHEYIPVKGSEMENSWLRFWLKKKNISSFKDTHMRNGKLFQS